MASQNKFLFTEETLLAQIGSTPYELGFYHVRFFSKGNVPVNEITDSVADYYLYPSGGALRDADFNIVFYSAKFDTYRGFIPPNKHD